MIYENVNGILQPIENLYENIVGGGIRQQIDEKYETINGIRRQVYDRNLIKTVQLIDSNGNPMNGLTGDVGLSKIQMTNISDTFIYGFSAENNTSSSLMYNYNISLGVAMGKKVLSMKVRVWGNAWNCNSSNMPATRIFYNDSMSSVRTFNYVRLSGSSPYQWSIQANSYYIDYTFYPNIILNTILIDGRNFVRPSSSYVAKMETGLTDMIVEYEN